MRGSRTVALAGTLLLCGCEGEERLRNAAQADVDQAVDDARRQAEKASEKIDKLGQNLKREATRTADKVDFGDDPNPPARGQ